MNVQTDKSFWGFFSGPSTKKKNPPKPDATVCTCTCTINSDNKCLKNLSTKPPSFFS